jgi:hypothetical protein
VTSALPPGYEALEPFVPRFAVSGTAHRAALRGDTSEDERRAFYEAAKDLIGPALDQLDAKPLRELDERERRLLDLALTFAHVALAVEIQGPQEGDHAAMRDYMRITRSPADAVAAP